MNKVLNQATQTLFAAVGQNKIMALATRNGDNVASRTVNVYTDEHCFYFVTEVDSNKYHQITCHNQVALSVDAIQIAGYATLLEHPTAPANTAIINYIEQTLPQQFDRYAANPVMRLIKITPCTASFILLTTGTGFSIDFVNKTAAAIKHQ